MSRVSSNEASSCVSTRQRLPKTLFELRARLRDTLPGMDFDNVARPVALLGHAGGTTTALSTDSDVARLFAGGPSCAVGVEVREIFPSGAPEPQIVDFCALAPPDSEPSVVTNTGTGEGYAGAASSRRTRSQGRTPRMAFGRRLEDAWEVTQQIPPPSRVAPEVPRTEAIKCTRRTASSGIPDGRPGRHLDRTWNAHLGPVAIDRRCPGPASTQLLDMAGIRQDFEELEAATRSQKHTIGRLLRPRWRATDADVPEPLWLKISGKEVESTSPALSGMDEILLRANDSFGPGDWSQDLGGVNKRDIAGMHAAMNSLERMEADFTSRLRDTGHVVTWRINGARRQIAEEQPLSSGGSQLTPRKVLIESSWMQLLPEVGRVMFRLLPCGDASSPSQTSAIWIWAESPPQLTFALEVGGIQCLAPRLWPADQKHYRVDCAWREIVAALAAADAAGDDTLELALRVLQLHTGTPSVHI